MVIKKKARRPSRSHGSNRSRPGLHDCAPMGLCAARWRRHYGGLHIMVTNGRRRFWIRARLQPCRREHHLMRALAPEPRSAAKAATLTPRPKVSSPPGCLGAWCIVARPSDCATRSLDRRPLANRFYAVLRCWRAHSRTIRRHARVFKLRLCARKSVKTEAFRGLRTSLCWLAS